MTKQELRELLHVLELDYEADASMMYVFYEMPDGRVNNFSISVRRGKEMTDEEVVALMRREYPSTREGRLLCLERQEGRRTDWMDAHEVRQWLHISATTLRVWQRRGYLKGYALGGRVYYDRAEIDKVIRSGAIQENGRFDKTALVPTDADCE